MMGLDELEGFREDIKAAVLQHEEVSLVTGSLRIVVDADRDLSRKILVAVDAVLKKEEESIKKLYQKI